MPKVSIIMPVYNNADYVEDAIISVLIQTYQDFELIIIDDCSTDTRNLETYKKFEHHPQVKIYLSQVNNGISKSKNLGMKYATGEYIGWLASDDKMKQNFIEENMKMIEQYPDTILFSNYEMINAENKLISVYDKIPFFMPEEEIINDRKFRLAIYYFYKAWDMFVNYNNIFAHKKYFTGENAFWEGVREHEDLYHILHIAIVKKYDFVFINKVLTQYRHHPKQFTHEAKDRQLNNYIAITHKIEYELGEQLTDKVC